MRVEHDTLNLSPMRHIINAYPTGENNCGDDSSLLPPNDGHLCDTIISDNTDLSSNKIT